METRKPGVKQSDMVCYESNTITSLLRSNAISEAKGSWVLFSESPRNSNLNLLNELSIAFSRHTSGEVDELLGVLKDALSATNAVDLVRQHINDYLLSTLDSVEAYAALMRSLREIVTQIKPEIEKRQERKNEQDFQLTRYFNKLESQIQANDPYYLRDAFNIVSSLLRGKMIKAREAAGLYDLSVNHDIFLERCFLLQMTVRQLVTVELLSQVAALVKKHNKIDHNTPLSNDANFKMGKDVQVVKDIFSQIIINRAGLPDCSKVVSKLQELFPKTKDACDVENRFHQISTRMQNQSAEATIQAAEQVIPRRRHGKRFPLLKGNSVPNHRTATPAAPPARSNSASDTTTSPAFFLSHHRRKSLTMSPENSLISAVDIDAGRAVLTDSAAAAEAFSQSAAMPASVSFSNPEDARLSSSCKVKPLRLDLVSGTKSKKDSARKSSPLALASVVGGKSSPSPNVSFDATVDDMHERREGSNTSLSSHGNHSPKPRPPDDPSPRSLNSSPANSARSGSSRGSQASPSTLALLRGGGSLVKNAAREQSLRESTLRSSTEMLLGASGAKPSPGRYSTSSPRAATPPPGPRMRK